MIVETREWRTRKGRYDYRIDGGEWKPLEWGCVVVLDGGMEGQMINRNDLAKKMHWTPRQCRYHTAKGLASLTYQLQRGEDFYLKRMQELAAEFWPPASSKALKARRQRKYWEREKELVITNDEIYREHIKRHKAKQRIKEEAEARVVAKDVGCPLLTQFASMRFSDENAGAGRS